MHACLFARQGKKKGVYLHWDLPKWKCLLIRPTDEHGDGWCLRWNVSMYVHIACLGPAIAEGKRVSPELELHEGWTDIARERISGSSRSTMVAVDNSKGALSPKQAHGPPHFILFDFYALARLIWLIHVSWTDGSGVWTNGFQPRWTERIHKQYQDTKSTLTPLEQSEETSKKAYKNIYFGWL